MIYLHFVDNLYKFERSKCIIIGSWTEPLIFIFLEVVEKEECKGDASFNYSKMTKVLDNHFVYPKINVLFGIQNSVPEYLRLNLITFWKVFDCS